MSAPRPRPRRALMGGLMVAGLGGFVGLAAWAAQAPAHADLLHTLALAWLLVFGLARLFIRLSDLAETPPESRSRSNGPWG